MCLCCLLQGWGLSDRDMSQLYPLEHLCQLNIKGSDPWLLSDAALQQLPEELPLLSSIVRDGQQLLPYGTHLQAATQVTTLAGAPAGPADMGNSHGCHSSSAAVCASPNSSTSTSYQGIWQGPQIAVAGEAQLGMQGVESPWLLQYLPQPRSPGGSSKVQQQQQSTPASKSTLRQGPGSSRTSADRATAHRTIVHRTIASSSSGGGGRGGTVYQRLSAYDERYKYSSGELLALRDLCVGPGAASGAVGRSPGSNSSSGSRRSSSSDTPADLLGNLPPEIRAGANW
jgi:hypothetical protein